MLLFLQTKLFFIFSSFLLFFFKKGLSLAFLILNLQLALLLAHFSSFIHFFNELFVVRRRRYLRNSRLAELLLFLVFFGLSRHKVIQIFTFLNVEIVTGDTLV